MSVGWKKTAFVCLATFLVCSSLTNSVVNADDPERKRVVADNDAADLTSDHDEAKEDSIPVQLTKWLSAVEGGFFNAKQEIKPVTDDSESSGDSSGRVFHGIFANEFSRSNSELTRTNPT